MKIFFKWSFRITIILIFIGAIAYGIFHLWEYSTGGRFITYLSQNSQTVHTADTFTFKGLDDDIEKSKLILVGEVHGFNEPNKFDVHFFKYLHQNFKVKSYVAELDFIQATLLNDYLQSGDEETLKLVLKRWAVIQGRNNQDYFNKFKEFQKYYSGLPEESRFRFIGIDQFQDLNLAFEYLKSYSATPEKVTPESYTISTLLEELIKSTENKDTLFLLTHLKDNADYYVQKVNREEIMFRNFYKLYKEDSLEYEKVYGFFGLMHVFQYKVNGGDPLASKIRQSDLGLADKILSFNFVMNDSYMVMQSRELPGFLQDDGTYTKMPVSSDNMLLLYVIGIKDFKRMTPEHHKSLIKMNAPNTPYANSVRLNKNIQLLPFAGKMELDEKGKPYVQYTIFVRNSAWAAPMEN